MARLLIVMLPLLWCDVLHNSKVGLKQIIKCQDLEVSKSTPRVIYLQL